MECQVCKSLNHEDGWIVRNWASFYYGQSFHSDAHDDAHDLLLVTLQGYGRLSVSSTFRFALYGCTLNNLDNCKM